MKKKSYKITFCLGAGYAGTGKIYEAKEAEQVIKNWMLERIENQLPTVSGILVQGRLLFPAKGRRADGSIVTVSPTMVYSGDVSYNTKELKNDSDIKDTLESLAKRIKEKFAQDKVYIIFEDENWFV